MTCATAASKWLWNVLFPTTCACPWAWQLGSKQSCHPPTPQNIHTHVCVCPCLQVILVSASLRANSLQTATAWTDRDPINVCSEAPADATPAARAAAAAAEAGQAAVKPSAWGKMLPYTISHQVGRGKGCQGRRGFQGTGPGVVSWGHTVRSQGAGCRGTGGLHPKRQGLGWRHGTKSV